MLVRTFFGRLLAFWQIDGLWHDLCGEYAEPLWFWGEGKATQNGIFRFPCQIVRCEHWQVAEHRPFGRELDQIVLKLYGQMLMFNIGQNQHELDNGQPYQGDAKKDVKEIDLYLNYVSNIGDEILKIKFYDAFLQELQLAKSRLGII